jgi:hypothetical protein
MKRRFVPTLAAVSVLAIVVATGTAWAQPTGNADVPQILNGITLKGEGGSDQRTFLTTDPVTFEAVYYDPFPLCAGEPPQFVQFFIFNAEGEFVTGQQPADSVAFEPGSKYRLLFLDLGPGSLLPSVYNFTFLVRSCDDEISVILPEFLRVRVVAP